MRAHLSRTARAVVLSLGAALAVAACSAGPDAATPEAAPAPAPTRPGTVTSSTVSSSPSSSGRSSPAPRTTAPTTATAADVATGLATPWGIALLADGSHLVSLRDRAQVVKVAVDGAVSDVVATGPGGRVEGVAPQGEGGLLGLAVTPAVPDTLYAYVSAESENRVVRMSYDGARLGAPEVLLDGIPRAGFHNGGRLGFGPDGMLYVTTGDAGRRDASQDRDDLGGKILRLTPDGDPAPGNPFGDSPVWSYGHRNVQGIGWDAAGRMYASEFGQDTWDELNRIEPGRNYGWPNVEGAGTDQDVADGFTRPLRVWRTSDASPSGLAVTDGAIYLAALRGERLWRVPLAADGAVGTPLALLRGELGRLRAVEVERSGSLLVLTDNTGRGRGRDGDDRLARVTLN